MSIFDFFKKNHASKSAYTSVDNIGTVYRTTSHVDAAWLALNVQGKTTPFVCYLFKTESDARNALCSLSFIHIASDTGELISTEVINFGYYQLSSGSSTWEAMVWGDSMTSAIYEESIEKFKSFQGSRKGDRAPKHVSFEPLPSQVVSQEGVRFCRTKSVGHYQYDIYRCGGKTSALEFLKKTKVTKRLFYLTIETPDGCFGKDIDGIYDSCLKDAPLNEKAELGCINCEYALRRVPVFTP